MLQIWDKVNVLTQDLSFIYDSGVITGITPESEESFATFQVTLDNSWKVMSVGQKEIDRLQLIDENEEAEQNIFEFFKAFVSDKKRLAITVLILLAVIGGAIIFTKWHHATPKVENALQIPKKTQIQVWTDEMAALEQEKATHYERQKYLRGEDKKEVSEVKKLDRKINDLKDKIHLYVTPADNE